MPERDPDELLTYEQIGQEADPKVPANTVKQWRKRHPDKFPPPDETVGRIPRWKRSTIAPFLALQRKPGRPWPEKTEATA